MQTSFGLRATYTTCCHESLPAKCTFKSSCDPKCRQVMLSNEPSVQYTLLILKGGRGIEYCYRSTQLLLLLFLFLTFSVLVANPK